MRKFCDELEIRRKSFPGATILAALAAPVLICIIGAPSIRAQSAVAARPQFEVASVKPNTTNGRVDSFPLRSGDQIQMHNNQVGSMIMYAYHVYSYQIIGETRLPDPWNWYDIDAKVEGTPTDEEIRLMFQSLLEDRFKLKVHHETKEMEVYKLEVAKNGSKLKPSTTEDYRTTIEGKSVVMRKGKIGITMWKEGAHLIGKGVTMTQLAGMLIGPMDGPVVDATGIEGTFDFDVVFAPANWPPDSEFSPPFLAAALKNELGLTIEKGKAPVDILVIDHLEKASPN
jgi:uncharacterized protein (TIGR03435 family)